MTIAGKIESTIAVPDGVTASMTGNTVTIRGPKGELSRNFAHPSVNVAIGEGDITVSCEYPRIKEKAMVGTFHAHLRNMIHGVTEGYTYQLKVVFSHFPMKVAVKGDKVEVNNYMEVGQTAANIERATSRGGFDKRIFQDGIYIVHKSHKVKE